MGEILHKLLPCKGQELVTAVVGAWRHCCWWKLLSVAADDLGSHVVCCILLSLPAINANLAKSTLVGENDVGFIVSQWLRNSRSENRMRFSYWPEKILYDPLVFLDGIPEVGA